MDATSAFALLGQHMETELDEEDSNRKPSPGCDERALPVYQAKLPNGKQIPLLKTMLTSVCERNCNYCAFRSGRDMRRATFKPDDLANSFAQMHHTGSVQGLFLSSGLTGGGVRTQDRLLDAAEILRKKHQFRGYLHLKIMPGAEKDQVLRAMQLADRVSINLEGPNDPCLARLAPQKSLMDELLKPLRWVNEIRNTQDARAGWNGRWPSSTTQFVVGAAGEHDLDLLRATAFLHQKLRLARVYFSGFAPVPGTPFEDQSAVDPLRRTRLYQASFLLRDYGFGYEDLPLTPGGDLPLDVDPKLAWARANLEQAPLEVNRSSREDLLRIPGIGPRAAQAILAARRRGSLRSLEDLKALGIRPNRAAPFILLDGKRPPRQLSLL
jgi:predicted DNA-binding helix-hairpin-helix protein